MSLSTIPSKVYIFIKESERSHSAMSSDCFANIHKIQINFNGVSGVLASASEWELWRMSVNNGLKMSYPQWQFYTGSVLCIDFGKDIGLSPNQCVGLLGQYDFNYSLDYKVLNTELKKYDLYTVIDYAGIYTIQDQQIVRQLGIVRTSDVLEADEYNEMDGEYLERLYGGNFMTGLKNVYTKAQKLKPYAQKAVRFGRDLAPIVETLIPRARPALDKGLDFAAELLGMGYSKAEIAKLKKMGYTMRDLQMLQGGNVVGGNVVGGALHPKDKMMKRIASYR